MRTIARGFAAATTLLLFSLSAFGDTKTRACPPGMRPSVHGCVDGARKAKLRTKEALAPVREAAPPRPDSSLRSASNEHPALELQRKTLLLGELQRLEAVLRITPRDASDRALLLRRIADTYAELAAVSERVRIRAQERADTAARRERLDAQKRAVPKKEAPAPSLPEPGEGTIL